MMMPVPLPQPVLSLKGVHFSYGERPVIENVALDILPGSFLAIVGPNGCGKSTVLKIMAGLLKPNKGEVLLGAAPLQSIGRRSLARSLAMLAQSNEAPPGMIVDDLVGMGRFAHETWLKQRTEEDRAQISQAMRIMEIEDLAMRRVGELSGGQVQRCRMAMTLAQDAGILLLDEPTNHLDLKYQYSLLETAREQARAGRAVVAVLHDLTQASLYADRLVLMNKGKLFSQGTSTEVLTSKAIDQVYGVRTTSMAFGRAIIHLPQKALQ
jgi:iron complex transport system ATP-binding protein